jgi:hypothetical protein
MSKKKQSVVVEDESDFFIQAVNKKIRNMNKKLREVQDLEKIVKSELKKE